MLRSKSILATLLALNLFFNEAQAVPGVSDFSKSFDSEQKVIGYATVDSDLATRINIDNSLFPENDSPRLGPGFSLLNDPNLLQKTARPGDWFCAVKADKYNVEQAGKTYIPGSYLKQPMNERQNLWQGLEDPIIEYLKTFKDTEKPAEALRFGWAEGFEEKMHMLIPERVILYGDLFLWAQCFETENELKNLSDDIIDWYNKEEWDIKGAHGPEHYPEGWFQQHNWEDDNGEWDDEGSL